jgi:hypothetical protein
LLDVSAVLIHEAPHNVEVSELGSNDIGAGLVYKAPRDAEVTVLGSKEQRSHSTTHHLVSVGTELADQEMYYI